MGMAQTDNVIDISTTLDVTSDVLNYNRSMEALGALRTMRMHPKITKDMRQAMRPLIDSLQDATHGRTAKINDLNEELKAMLQHKTYAEDAQKTREVVREYAELINAEIEKYPGWSNTIGLVNVTELLADDKVDNYNLYKSYFVNFEDVLFE